MNGHLSRLHPEPSAAVRAYALIARTAYILNDARLTRTRKEQREFNRLDAKQRQRITRDLNNVKSELINKQRKFLYRASSLISPYLEEKEGYKTVGEYTNPDVTVVYHHKRHEFVIAIRGTDTSNPETINHDLHLDLKIGLNNFTALLDERIDHIREVIRVIQENTKTVPRIVLVGHSLGGSSAYAAMTQDEVINKNVNECHCFNPGTTILSVLFNSSRTKLLRTGSRLYTHHVEGDRISRHSSRLRVGIHLTYTLKSIQSEHNSWFNPYSLLRNATSHIWGFKYLMPAGQAIRETAKAHSIENFFVFDSAI